MKRPLIIALGLGGLGLVAGCLDSPHKACHRRALEQLGCCPFHGEGDCGGADTEAIKSACADELGFEADPDEGGESEGSSPADVP